MTIPLYQIDAFTHHLFGGNPAAVCPLDAWLPDEQMQQIAAENNLAETAFYVPQGDHFGLRWFTPTVEVDLCGHATLATAYVLFQVYDYSEAILRFATRSGILTVEKEGERLVMDFPSDTLASAEVSSAVRTGLGDIQPVATFRGQSDYLIVLENQSQLEALQPDFRKMGEDTTTRAIIVTAPGVDAPGVDAPSVDAPSVDFVSRCFAPAAGIDEDPVTGSAHTTLTPYWAGRLGRAQLTARQLSSRGGILYCTHQGQRTKIAGEAVLYLQGEIYLK